MKKHQNINTERMETAVITLNEVCIEYIDLVKTQHSPEMLDIKGFVSATNYNIDPLIIDEQ